MPTDTEMEGEIFPQHLQSPQPLLVLKPKYFTHTVRGTGETLIAIARWYTGNGYNWKHLAQVNPDIDPQLIHIGDAIRIPEKIMTTRQPMPRSIPSTTVAGK